MVGVKIEAKRRAILLHLFRERQASRLGLARALGLNASMVGTYVETLLGDGLVLEDHAGGTRRGRIPVPVRLNPAHGCFLGIDFEALRARAVLTDFSGDVLYRRELVFKGGVRADALLRGSLGLARAVARRRGRLPLLAAGVAAPGQIDVSGGRLVRYALVPDFVDVPVRALFEKALGVPTAVEDNIRSLTIAEMLRGAGRGRRDVLCLAVRSGMGLGIVIGGKLHRGQGDRAGVVGFSYFPQSGGPKRMTELVAASGILVRAPGVQDAAELIRRAEGGDRALARLLGESGRLLGLFIANLANTFAPEMIILAGEVPTWSPLLRGPLEATWAERLLPELRPLVRLEDSRLEGYGAALGAAALEFTKS